MASASAALRQAQDSPPAGEEWPGLDKLTGVQDLLDQNKLLISEINQNHELRTPDALQRNAMLIRQLNKNIATVVDLYTSLASLVEPFSAAQQHAAGAEEDQTMDGEAAAVQAA